MHGPLVEQVNGSLAANTLEYDFEIYANFDVAVNVILDRHKYVKSVVR